MVTYAPSIDEALDTLLFQDNSMTKKVDLLSSYEEGIDQLYHKIADTQSEFRYFFCASVVWGSVLSFSLFTEQNWNDVLSYVLLSLITLFIIGSFWFASTKQTKLHGQIQQRREIIKNIRMRMAQDITNPRG